MSAERFAVIRHHRHQRTVVQPALAQIGKELSQGGVGIRDLTVIGIFKLFIERSRRVIREHPPIKRMITEALPIMQQVAHDLNQSCHLGVLNGDQVVIIAQVDSPVSTGFYVKAGAVVDVMRAATGHVILAHQTQEICARAVQAWCKHNKMAAPRDLALHLAAIKLRGYEEKESYQVEGVINVSCPILDEYGYAVAALTVPYIRRIGDNTTPTTVRQTLKQASFQLSQAIGGISQRRTKLAT